MPPSAGTFHDNCDVQDSHKRRHCIKIVGWGSVGGIATGYRLDGPGIEYRWGRDQPLGPPSLPYSGYWVSFSKVKRPGCRVDHAPPSGAEVKERVQLYLYSPSGPSGPVLRWTLSHIIVRLWCFGTWRYRKTRYFHLQSIPMKRN